MILLVALLGGCAAGWLAGGRLRNLEHLELKYSSAILILFVAQALLRGSVVGSWFGGAHVVVVAWCLCAGGLVILAAANRRIPGMLLVAAGISMNLLVVAANAGMPLSGAAATSIGAGPADLAQSLSRGFYSLVSADTRLVVLADVIPLPGFRGWRSVVSIGDLLMVIGAAVVLAAGMKPQTARVGSSPPQDRGSTSA